MPRGRRAVALPAVTNQCARWQLARWRAHSQGGKLSAVVFVLGARAAQWEWEWQRLFAQRKHR